MKYLVIFLFCVFSLQSFAQPSAYNKEEFMRTFNNIIYNKEEPENNFYLGNSYISLPTQILLYIGGNEHRTYINFIKELLKEVEKDTGVDIELLSEDYTDDPYKKNGANVFILISNSPVNEMREKQKDYIELMYLPKSPDQFILDFEKAKKSIEYDKPDPWMGDFSLFSIRDTNKDITQNHIKKSIFYTMLGENENKIDFQDLDLKETIGQPSYKRLNSMVLKSLYNINSSPITPKEYILEMVNDYFIRANGNL